MALLKTSHANGTKQMPSPMGSELVAVRMEYNLSGALALNDVIELGSLPADCVPVDLIIDTDDLGTTGAGSVGILNAGKTALSGSAWTTSANLNAAAAGLRADSAGLRAMSRVAASGGDQPIGMVVTQATTATTGTVGVTLMYRSA